MIARRLLRPWRLAALPLLLAAGALGAQQRPTSPKEFFGHDIGDDYWLATYDQFAEYWRRLDGQSDRMRVVEIGKTAEGRPQLMAIVSSPANMARLDHYRGIAARLARAEGVTEEQARALAAEGKAVVWIDGGLHANEVLGAHQLIETVWQLVSRDDAETRRILDDVIVLAVHANPDGMQLVSSWYMREREPARRNMMIPRLYQKYIGHDNNRDFYMSSQAETQNMNRTMYREWYPQIVYNHHQTGPTGTVMFAPPFRDPFNYNFDPGVPAGVDVVGSAMHERFILEGKPGVTSRSGAPYSTWWNGGLRTTVYFHNMIGLLTETIGNPTPMRIAMTTETTLPRGDLAFPIAPQEWHFRQSVDYSVTANYAVLDIASRKRDTFLYNIWRMGRNSIERGSRDAWTITPATLARVDSAIAADSTGPCRRGAAQRGVRTIAESCYATVVRDPARRDPRGYVIPASQRDFATATKFVNALRHTGVDVLRATADFTVAGKRYPAGSFVVKTAQAFRPHVLDMFEPQHHPNDFAYPGGPPRRPYDTSGWTLAYQMGVEFDRILEGFDGPFAKIEEFAPVPEGRIAGAANATGWLVGHEANDAIVLVNRLLQAGERVQWLRAPVTAEGRTWPAGTFYVTARSSARTIVERAARELGLTVTGTTARVPADATPLRAPRIALWDTYGGSMPSGWTRWLLEQYGFAGFDVVFPQQLDAGNLRAKYDVLVLPDGAIPEGQGGRQLSRDSVPAEFAHMVGRITPQRTVPQLRRFLEEGGTIVTIGSSTRLGELLGLPVSNWLVERTPTGRERPIPEDRFYVPGSVLRVAVDTTAGVAAGLRSDVDVFYDNSPVFHFAPGAALRGVRPIAWFDTARPLRSGWAWGQNYLEGGVAIAEANVGRGKLYLFGPEVLFRAQPHGTFKFFFNALYRGGEPVAVQ